MDIKFNCRNFMGDKPCRFNKLCPDCGNYQATGKRILIIKLAAIGDVLRTTSILSGLKRKFPGCHISWLVNDESIPILENNPKIDRVLTLGINSLPFLLAKHFDLALGLDKAIEAAAIASLVKAKEKKGFGLHKNGYLYPLNKESEYAFRLGIDNRLKFKENKKTYQEIIYEMAGLEYKNDEYVLCLAKKNPAENDRLFKKFKAGRERFAIGLNTGSGEVFAAKKWPVENFIELARLLNRNMGIKPLLLGGPNEVTRNKRIKSALKGKIIDTGCDNSLPQFMNIINQCFLIVSSDTLAMQVAIALKKKVVALFGSTCHQEIDLYGRGEKIFSSISCSPCYRNNCPDVKCMSLIRPKNVFAAIKRLIGK